MIPLPVSTHTDSPLQQGFAVQDEELLDTSYGTIPWEREGEKGCSKCGKICTPHGCTKGPYIGMRGRLKGRGEERGQGAPSPHVAGAPREGRGPLVPTHTSTHPPFSSTHPPIKTHTCISHVDYPLSCHVGQVGPFCMQPCHAYVAATYSDKSKCAAHNNMEHFHFLSLNKFKYFR